MSNSTTVFLLMVVALFIYPVVAQAAQLESEARLGASAGITPDSSLYVFDKAFERIELALATSANAKAHTHLEFAEERLAEMEETAAENKTEAAAEARAEYEKEIEATEREASSADAETRANIESRLRIHVTVLQALQTRFEAEGIAGAVGIRTALESSSSTRVSGNTSANASIGIRVG